MRAELVIALNEAQQRLRALKDEQKGPLAIDAELGKFPNTPRDSLDGAMEDTKARLVAG